MFNFTLYRSLILIALFLVSTISFAQNLLDGPESVAYDSVNNRYLVSSLRTNKIISIDKQGNQSLFKESIVAYGNCIKDSVLYVTGNATIRGLNVNTAEDIFTVTVPGVQQFDGITADNSGFIYALATRIGIVYKVHIETKNYWAFVDSGFGAAPQDLIYDSFKNRIIACQWHDDSDLLAIDLMDSTLSVVVENTAGRSDGVTIDKEGNIYFTSYSREGEIYMCDNDFSNPPELIYIGIPEPAGLDYNIVDNILAVPSFIGDKVEFIKMPPTYLFPKVSFDFSTGHAPLEVTFTDISSSNPKINKWEWDFENDGVFDSEEQNPTWIFNEPGVYKLKANFHSDSLSSFYAPPDSILVFEGESSLSFLKTSSRVTIKPNESFDFKNNWTFETWIKPTSLHGKYIFENKNIQIYTNRLASGFNKNSLVVKLIREDNTTIRFSTEDSSLVTNKWQHVAVTYSLSNQLMDVYIDGKLQALSLDNSSIFESPISDDSYDTLILGNNYSGLRSLVGNLDEVRMWNIFKSKEEIEENLYSYLEGNEPGLILYWKMNEGNGEILEDNSQNHLGGIIENCRYDWGIDYSTLVSAKEKIEINSNPMSFSLFQNYPNPFNPSTKIKYSIPERGNVELKVFDVLGREVKTLVNKEQPSGAYEIEFNGTKLASGIYFYTIHAGKYIKTKKMVLIK